MARPRRRRLILAIVVLLLLAAVGVAVVYVLGVGRDRTDPFRRAVQTRDGGDVAGAEAQLRSLLQTDPSHLRARDMLIEILSRSGRIEEAEGLARYWLSDPVTEAFGLRSLSELAFRRNDFPAALRYARMVADRDPTFAQAILLQVQDLLGTPAALEGSVRAAESLGMLARRPVARATAFLYVAETLRDLESTLPDGPKKALYAERRERARTAALAADLTKESADAPRQESHAEAMSRSGRIQLLSSDKAERLEAVKKLEGILASEPNIFSVRASLVGYYLAAGDLEKATNHARLLRGAPPMYSIRAISSLAARKEARVVALEILQGATEIPEKPRDLLRARILIAREGTDTEREQGIQAFERLAQESSPPDIALIQEAYRLIKEAGDHARARRLLDAAALREPKLRVAALMETVAATSESGSQDLDAQLANLAAAVDIADLPTVFVRLDQTPKVGESTAFAFLQKALDAGKVDAAEVRLLRAGASALRPGKAPDGRAWSEQAREDLANLVGDPKVSTKVLLKAATLIRVVSAYRLFGALLVRVLTSEVEQASSLELYLRETRNPDESSRDLVAQGMRESSGASAKYGPWLSSLADALARGDVKTLRRKSGDRAPVGERPQPTEMLLQLELAGRAADWPEAEAFARALLADSPNATEASERLGATLLKAKKFEEVLALHAKPTPTPMQRLQRIEALWGLARKKDAVAEAHLLVRETEGSDRALIVLGWLLRDSDPSAALSALAAAAGNPEADFMRAEVLERRGDEDAAVQVYEDILRASGDRNFTAWQGLAKVRAAQNADWKFIERISTVIDAPPRGINLPELLLMVMQRGLAYDRKGQYEQALADYRRVIKNYPKDAVALNNAAWLIGGDLVRRTEDVPKWRAQALDLIDRAIAAAPNAAPIHHTRAKILLALDRLDDAVGEYDKAIELMTADLDPKRVATMAASDLEFQRGRLARYLLDKSALLERKGDVEGAVVIYRRVVENHPGTYQATQAKDALVRLSR